MKHYYSVQLPMPLVFEWIGSRLLLYAFLVISFWLLSVMPSQGQTPESQPWTLHSTNWNVSIYYKFSKCERQDVVLLKFENTGDSAVEVSWRERLTIKGKKVLVGNGKLKMLTIPPGETVAKDYASTTELVTPVHQYVSLVKPASTHFDIFDVMIVSH